MPRPSAAPSSPPSKRNPAPSLRAIVGENADAVSVERTMLDNLPMLDNNYVDALVRVFSLPERQATPALRSSWTESNRET